MGRQKRESAKFEFNGKKVEMYRPTGGQSAALALVSSGKTPEQRKEGLVRFFRIIENLTVSAASWTLMDDALVEGKAEVEDFAALLKLVLAHDWDAAETSDGGE